MNISETIASHITESYDGNNWTGVNIAGTINDIAFEEAITITPASFNSIASILYHLKFYNEIMLQRLKGIAPKINAANGFDMPELKSEKEWNYLVDAVNKSFNELAKAAKIFPEERLNETGPEGQSTYYKNLHGIAEHAHYHLGQIVMLKKLIRSKK